MAGKEPRKKQGQSRRPPARTPEEQEGRLIALATELAERQLTDGTATAQVITHYLKLGSTREQLEQEKLSRENHVLETKADMMASAQRVEEMYSQALSAMRSYSGQELSQEDGYED